MLLLTAGDGPWMWESVRYEAFSGALAGSEHMVSFKASNLRRLRLLGSGIIGTSEEREEANKLEECPSIMRTFHFGESPVLTLEQTTYDKAGVGYQYWDASIALTIYLRSPEGPILPSRPRVLELGAGVGVPGFDTARRYPEGTVTLTDARQHVVRQLHANIRHGLKHEQPWGGVRVSHLQWGSGATSPADPVVADEVADVSGQITTSVTDGGDRPATTRQEEEWGSEERTGGGADGQFDLVIGSDICYDERAVAPLAELLVEKLDARLTMVIGPVTRPVRACTHSRPMRLMPCQHTRLPAVRLTSHV